MVKYKIRYRPYKYQKQKPPVSYGMIVAGLFGSQATILLGLTYLFREPSDDALIIVFILPIGIVCAIIAAFSLLTVLLSSRPLSWEAFIFDTILGAFIGLLTFPFVVFAGFYTILLILS